MNPKCNNDCTDSFSFPKPIDNSPGLPNINYSIGRYSGFRKALLKKLDKNDNFKGWTYRGSDDPGIALLEGVSILGDILIFYQELYANEKFLRTAKWRESVASLVKLLGYRLAPGIASQTTFAVQVKGEKSIIVPKGTQFKVQLEKLPQQTEFETFDDAKFYPQLSKFKLFSPRILPPPFEITISNTEFYISEGYQLKKGDRLIIGFAATDIDDPKNPDRLSSTQIVIVDEIRIFHGQQLFKIKGNIDNNIDPKIPFVCYKLGRSFSHFGHNTPRTIVNVTSDGKANENLISYTRNTLEPTNSQVMKFPDEISMESVVRIIDPTPLDEHEFPLATIVNDIPVGNKLIIQGYFFGIFPAHFIHGNNIHYRVPAKVSKQLEVFVRTINNITTRSITWGSISGSTSMVELDKKENLLAAADLPGDIHVTDIRNIQFHEVISSKLTMNVNKIDLSGDGNQFNFYADGDQSFASSSDVIDALKGRDIQIVRVKAPQTKLDIVKVIDINPDSDSSISNAFTLTLDHNISNYEDFSNNVDINISDVYGNLVYSTQGKTQNETALGNGDNSQKFQSFKIPKSPLTYLFVPDETPPQVPALEIYVNERLWIKVGAFFNRGPNEQIYIVREDSNGDSWVQFGDGKTGSRLPSGLNNIVSKWRTGVGANGHLKEGSTVQLTGRVDRFDKAQLFSDPSGGSQQETGEHAKDSAPGKIQSLDRIVSLEDFETETLSIPGIKKVSARWDLVDGCTPGVILTILMDGDQDQDFEKIRGNITDYIKGRGANHFPLSVIHGQFQDICIQINYAMDATFRQEIVEKAIRDALGVVQNEEDKGTNNNEHLTGLFGIDERQFGQSEYLNRIKGIAQEVAGVVWVDVRAFILNDNRLKTWFTSIISKKSISNPPNDIKCRSNMTLICRHNQILRLNIENLTLTRTSLQSMENCYDF